MKRIAVKIGSAVLTRKDGTLDVTRLSSLVDQVAELRHRGIEVILISSGAVASGRGELHLSQQSTLPWGRLNSSTATTISFASTISP